MLVPRSSTTEEDVGNTHGYELHSVADHLQNVARLFTKGSQKVNGYCMEEPADVIKLGKVLPAVLVEVLVKTK
jgi:hypothetical protein